MRRLLIAVITVLSLLSFSQAQSAPTAESVPFSETNHPYVIGLGAIAGVVGVQYLLFGASGFPFWPGSVPSGTVVAPEISVGISRMFATTSAVLGAWAGLWLYDH